MDLSNREKEIWIELIVSVAVAIYYFKAAYIAGGFNDIANAALAKVAVNAILMSIISTIILGFLFNKKNNEAKDERDIAIEARANSYAYYGLCIFISIIIAQIMIDAGIGYFESQRPAGEDIGYFEHDHIMVNLALVMHLMLMAMIAAGAIKSITQIYLYHQGD
ncbi:MAG: hypothetical protein H6912_00250 [Kordiimonadaceae bacterium]|nr:hypothetical protein [Kordiimonadaceae bacterium]